MEGLSQLSLLLARAAQPRGVAPSLCSWLRDHNLPGCSGLILGIVCVWEGERRVEGLENLHLHHAPLPRPRSPMGVPMP